VPHQFSYPFGEDLDPKNECLTKIDLSLICWVLN
jgi:hypothetical protein